MPLMREWTEIVVDEELLIPVVRELLDLAADPNQVEVVYGTHGRVILVEVHLAEYWYQERLKQDEAASQAQIAVVASADKAAPPAGKIAALTEVPSAPVQEAAPPAVAPAAKPASFIAPAAIPSPVKRVSATKPSASLDGEES